MRSVFALQGSGEWHTRTKSFLFSMANAEGIGPVKMEPLCGQSVYGVCCNATSGPAFGGGHDLHISDASNGANTDSYSFPLSYQFPSNQSSSTFLAGQQYFTVSEYEVFCCQKR